MWPDPHVNEHWECSNVVSQLALTLFGVTYPGLAELSKLIRSDIQNMF